MILQKKTGLVNNRNNVTQRVEAVIAWMILMKKEAKTELASFSGTDGFPGNR